LILHGFLRGFIIPHPLETKRGRRVFCSNRHKRKGCGRTFSILWADLIKNIPATTLQLGKFLQNILSGKKIKHAFDMSFERYSVKSRYSLYHKFLKRQTVIRALLSKMTKPPRTDEKNPLAQTMLHMDACFKDDFCPFEAFQRHFQTSIL
jgi:hypothetical protein